MERKPDADPDLPPSIAAAWGMREPPRKGPRPVLSADRIVDAAVAVASKEGLAALSMNRVAGELASSPMSLYRHVAGKDELLALMVDRALGPPPQTDPDEDWRAGLANWAWAFHAVLRRHPWTVRVPISGPPITPNQVAWIERGLRSMAATSLAEPEKMSTILLLSGYVRSEAGLVADLDFSAPQRPEVMPAWGRQLARLIDAEHFPALTGVLGSGVFDQDDHPDHEFTFGLERILDGVGALIGEGRDA